MTDEVTLDLTLNPTDYEAIAHGLARDPSTVSGSTVTVLDKVTGEVLATAIAPLEETVDKLLYEFESRGFPIDHRIEQITRYTAQRIDEVYAMADELWDTIERQAVDERFDLSWLE